MFHPYLADRLALADTLVLIETLGEYAASEAAARADRSRDAGNIHHFCRWRQIGAMIDFLEFGAEISSVH
ncbi:hypothetical protein [Sphingomonas sp. ID0503]|uniref:hypothetical protein n=1 Tax=Sphingomonas sp. ID0503 TaxID=3399691 RepID=UPI003AFB713A